MKRKCNILLILLLCFISRGLAQDPQLTQFYAAPIMLAPSFAGSTSGSRTVLNFRDQWPTIPGAFVTYAFGYDHYFPNLKSGVGLLLMRDQAGSGKLSSSQVGLQYSYNFKVGRKLYIRPGLYMYYSLRSIDYNRLLFGDQVSLESVAPSSVEVFPEYQNVGYIDFAASVMVHTELCWGGVTVDHLTEPNQSLLDDMSKVPLKYSAFGGAKFGLNDRVNKYNEESVSFAFLYKGQDKYDQLDFGLYWLKKPMVIGLWYRGIPVFKSYKTGYQNNDAVSILVGYRLQDFSVGYSYDFTVSRLITSTGGSHELSVIFEFFQDQKAKKKRKQIIVPCPKF